MSTTHVMLVADAAVEAALRAAVPELNGNLHRWPHAPSDVYVGRQLQAVMATSPDVVAFGPELPTESTLELAAELDRLHPDDEVLVLAEPTPRLWEQAARAGVREVVSPMGDPDELRLAVQRTMATVDARRAQGRSSAVPEPSKNAVMIVRSPKGGSGKTMVASNVAVLLAKRHPGEVVLVDLDLQFGDMANALGVDPTYTIADATASADLTPTALKALLSTHKSGLYTLCAPTRPEDASVITGDDVTAMLELLQSAFRFVVVDTAAGTDDRTLAALAAATDVVLVCSMDVSSVRALAKDLQSARDRGDGRARHVVVLNRADSRVALEVRDIEATIGRPIDVRVGSSRVVPLHMNCGAPVVEAETSSPVTKQLHELVAVLDPTAVTRPARGLRIRR
jgi:pilus assembly protein CpaE